MNIPFSRTSHLIPLILGITLLLSVISLQAQRLELHLPNKDFSTNATANKAWGVGGAMDFDQWVKRTSFRAHFDWAMFRKRDDITNPNYQRITAGISALYSFRIMEKLMFQCGAQVNYTHLRYAHVYGIDSTSLYNIVTLQQTGNFVGVAPHVRLHYEFSPRFHLGLNFIPTYLIPVSYKSSIKDVEPEKLEYNKGIWLFQLQLGFSFRLYKPD